MLNQMRTIRGLGIEGSKALILKDINKKADGSDRESNSGTRDCFSKVLDRGKRRRRNSRWFGLERNADC